MAESWLASVAISLLWPVSVMAKRRNGQRNGMSFLANGVAYRMSALNGIAVSVMQCVSSSASYQPVSAA
jgi:hypothetical protein